MAKFFKIMGLIGSLLLAIYLIWKFVLLMQNAEAAMKMSSTASSWWNDFILWLTTLVIGSTACVLFIYYGNRIDDQPKRINADNNYQKQKRALAKIFNNNAPKQEVQEEEEEEPEPVVVKEVPKNRVFEVELSDISAEENMVNIKGTTFNLDAFKISDISMTAKKLCFTISDRDYKVSYLNKAEAEELLNFLKEHESK